MANGKYRVIKGNAVNPTPIDNNQKSVIPHVCNNERAWGSGFVLAVSAKWPEPEKVYREAKDLSLGQIQSVRVDDDVTVVNMIAQRLRNTPKDRIPLSYRALVSCMEKVWFEFSAFGPFPEIHCPKFGSCRAGGSWETIEQLIKEIWVDNGFNVTVYEYKE